MMVPGVGLWRYIPFVFSFEWKVPYGADLEQSTKVMYNIPGWRGLLGVMAVRPGWIDGRLADCLDNYLTCTLAAAFREGAEPTLKLQ
jgi:hypothetical protein